MFKVKFADIGEGLTEGKVTEVMVELGQVIKEGDSLFHVETDKVNSEIPAPVGGKIAKIYIKADQEIKVGDVVIEIDDGTGVDVEPVKAEAKDEPVEENASVVGSTPVSNDIIPSRAPVAKKVEAPAALVASSTANKENVIKPKPGVAIEKEYDVIVIGAGIGGYISAIKTAQLGLKTLIIEKEYYGGVCLNVGCIPTKSLLKTAKVYEDIMHKAEKLGVIIENATGIKIDWTKAIGRKDTIVKKLTNGVKYLLTKNKVDQIIGEAEAICTHTIAVGGKNYFGKNIIIASGSVPISLPLPGFTDAIKAGFLIDSTAILSIPEIPKKLAVIGGGVIGVEFACLFASLGTEVTIIQGMPTILEMLDKDVIDVMTKEVKNTYNIKIITDAKVKEIKGKEVFFENSEGKTESVTADYCLQAVGRKTVTAGFENIGLELGPRKNILVDDYGETNISGVYAIGDVVGKAMLAQVATHAAIVAANRIAKKAGVEHAEDMIMDYAKVPSCIYTHPEVAMIGKTEQELIAAKVEYKQFKFPFAAIGKAMADEDTTGFVKIIIEPKYKTILGAHIVGNRATEMISEITSVIECEGTITEIARAIHPHPTMSEAVGETAEALETGFTINL